MVPIRQHILQSYAGVIAQRHGVFCVHAVLQDATFPDEDEEEEEDCNRVKFQLPIGKLNTEHLQTLLECMVAAEPGSVRALDGNGLLPVQVASQLNFPDRVIYVLLRPYPGALLLL